VEPNNDADPSLVVPRRHVERAGADDRGGAALADRPSDRLERSRSGECKEERRERCEESDGAAQEAQTSLESPAVATPGRFDGKTALVMGVANRRSIAWAIAKRLADEGARLAFTYQGERIEKNVRDLAESVSSPLVLECDVRADDDIGRVFSAVGETFEGGLDLLVHSLAFAAAEDLEGRFTDTPRDRFWLALDVSAYSLVACSRAAEPLMEARGGGSIVTMTYLGGERAVPHYNVMGVAKATLDASVRYLAWDLGEKNVRVNAISAGPVRTLAARSIAGFPTMEAIVEERAPLHRHIEADDVGAAAAYLLSDDAKNVSGTTLYVDSGYHAMGM
jgi:enoyl-[acyl-carrier protein] reductase I